MNGAVFYATKYGSTAEYAKWIGDATGLPVYDMQSSHADPSQFDFAILAMPVYYFKLRMIGWLKRNLPNLEGKPVILVTVSGAPPGDKLDGWIGKSLPDAFVSKISHVALRGRLMPNRLSWFDRLMLKIGAKLSSDATVRREETEGFDYMDKSGIAPVVAQARALMADKAPWAGKEAAG